MGSCAGQSALLSLRVGGLLQGERRPRQTKAPKMLGGCGASVVDVAPDRFTRTGGVMRVLLASMAVAIACCVAASAGAQDQPAPAPTIENFVAQEAALTSVVLSPSGAYVAYVRDSEETRHLIVHEVATNQARVVQALPPTSGQHFLWVQWKSDDRLVFGVRQELAVRSRESTGSRLQDVGGFGFSIYRVVSMPRDGGPIVEMFGQQSRQLSYGFGSTAMIDDLPTDPENILLIASDNGGVGVWRGNVNTGRVERVADGTYDTLSYAIDGAGYPVMRMDAIQNGAGRRFLRRASGERSWTTYRDFRRGERTSNSPDFYIVGPGPGPGQVYVLARPEDRDLLGLYLFDTATGALGAPLQEGRQADVSFPLIHPVNHQVLVTCEYAQKRTCASTDRGVDRHLRAVQSFFGAGVSVAVVSTSADNNTWLVYAEGPAEPGSYYVYSRANANMQGLAALYPRAPVASLSPVEIVTYQARDGAALWAYVTAQPGSGPRPTIILPHGGPEARDRFDYDSYAQFLASRGYVVVQPNFRGSLGFGRAFADAGRGQWGLRMQDDVTDVTRHMIAAGVADPRRICIVGASYGGYAALAGVALTPDLYRCAISIAGVSDLAESLRSERHANGRLSVNYQYWLRSIGNPNENRDALNAVSPARLADRVTAPVLLIHGTEDDNVEYRQSELMQRALERAGKPTRLIELEGAGHYWDQWSEEQRVTVFRESEAFLAQHLGAAR